MKGEGEGVSRYVPHIGCVMTEYKGGREGVSRYVRHIGCVMTREGGRGEAGKGDEGKDGMLQLT